MTDVTPQEHAYDEWCATIPGEFFVPHIAEAFEAGWNAAFDHTRPASTEPADALAEAREALQAHHDWHLARTEEDEHGIVLAEAYSESALCDQTLAALSRLNAQGEMK